MRAITEFTDAVSVPSRLAGPVNASPGLRDIWRTPLPGFQGNLRANLLFRVALSLFKRRILEVSGVENIDPVRGPFILAANHSTRYEVFPLVSLLGFLRGGRMVHFFADWNFLLYPGIGYVLRTSRPIAVTRKPARPRCLNLLKPWMADSLPPIERARDWLARGESVGIFPEGTTNRNARNLMRGDRGAAWLSLATGVPVVPLGIRFPDLTPGETRVPEFSRMELEFGRPLVPAVKLNESANLAAVKEWHAAIMQEISRLSRKTWNPQLTRKKMNLIDQEQIHGFRMSDEAGRNQALEVMRVIYRDEKNWVREDDKLISPDDLDNPALSWFVACSGGEPVGVLRVLYEPPLDLYQTYGFKLVVEDLDLDAFIRHHPIAEIGRFAVLPAFRKNIRVVATLMSAAVRDTVEREFTHYITDVFEGEQHSPYDFHSRVMGFKVVATHETGELNCARRRLTMLLDLREGYRRLRQGNQWIYRTLTHGWTEEMHRRMLGKPNLNEAEAGRALAGVR